MNGAKVSGVMRSARKANVFHVMYGYHGSEDMLPEDLIEWRTMAAEYINGERSLAQTPLTVESFYELSDAT